jgi:hypothetical protein
MRTVLRYAMVAILSAPMCAQQIIDRIVVVVNDRVITQNDWDEQEKFEALGEGRPPAETQHSPAALERLIDRVLLMQQMAQLNFRAPAPELIAQHLKSVKAQLPASKTETSAAWKQTLAAYGIPQDDFAQIVTDQANVLRFIDVRFRSNARISQFEIDNYYRDTFVPEFQKQSPGKTPPPLRQVQQKIQQILTEQRVTEGLNSFVQSLRTQAVIRRVAPMPPPIAKPAGTIQ